MTPPDEILVRGARYLIVPTDEGRLDVRHPEHQRSLGSLLLRDDGRAWGLIGDDYELTREIVAKVQEGSS